MGGCVLTYFSRQKLGVSKVNTGIDSVICMRGADSPNG